MGGSHSQQVSDTGHSASDFGFCNGGIEIRDIIEQTGRRERRPGITTTTQTHIIPLAGYSQRLW